MSIAIAHKKRAIAKALEQQPDRPTPTATPQNYDETVIDASLQQDLDRLSALEDVTKKVHLKKVELLPKYLPMVNAYLESGAHHTNPLLVRCAIWALDVEDMETAMPLIDACIYQQQLAPAYFKRDLVTFFVETIADWAERQLKEAKSGSPYIDAVCGYVLNDFWPINNEIVRGKLFKVAGQLAEANGDFKEALGLYIQAQEENDRAGCKGRIKKLEEKLGSKASE